MNWIYSIMGGRVRALVKAKAQIGLWMQDQPLPQVGHNDVLIKIKKTAICGTDLHIYQWDKWAASTIPVPLIIGHEFMGEVVDFGEEVNAFQKGDRVSGEGHITCGHCRNCRAGRRHLCNYTQGVGVNRAGAFAEYLSIPAVNVFKLPDTIDDETACLLDPFGNALHTAFSFDLSGEDVFITGAGPIGIMAAMLCRHVAARHVVITDINPWRLALVNKIDSSIITCNPQTSDLSKVMKKLGMQEGFDVGLEMSGQQEALNQMVDAMVHGGRIALLGLPSVDVQVALDQIILKGLFLKGIYGREMFETWYKMSNILQSGLDLKPLITHRFQIQNYEQAFDVMRQGMTGKTILSWD